MAVREPTTEEVEAMDDLAAILVWAGIRGDLDYYSCMAGSLLKALGSDEHMTVDDIATMILGDIDATLRDDWKYSETDLANGSGEVERGIVPRAMIKRQGVCST